MEYLKMDADAISEAISKMVHDEIAKAVRSQIKKLTPKQYEIKEMMEDIVLCQIHSLLNEEVERFKKEVLGPKITGDVQKIIEDTNILEQACRSVPVTISQKMKQFETEVFERVMNSKFKDPEKPVAYEFHQLMAKYITMAYEKSKPEQT